ncbi:hypothetical protein HWV62_2386 [Athelia sp. TMB]|nr:hypothetical protein HWV62_2386 [Athelia sp. TMB]
MDRVPVELWRKIFAHSCFDGGLTGCALSLVSKAVHDASRHCRYYSVALKGLPSALMFAQLLGKHHLDEIRVYHLHVTNQYPYAYLDCRPSTPTMSNAVTTVLKGISRKLFREKLFQRDVKKDVVQKALEHDPGQSTESLMHVTLLAILLAVAPTLETLSICIDFDFHDPAIPSLPRLTELTLNYSFGWRTHSITRVLGTLKRLPSLRMLDLLEITCHANSEDILAEVAKIAPNVTHICFPIIRGTNLLAMRPAANSTFWARVDSGELVIHMQLDPWYGRAEIYMSSTEWSREWQLLNRETSRRPGFVFHNREKAINECFGEQEENWQARMNGRAGRW